MPVIVEWNDSFSVGDAMLDQQHQKLLALCNEMAEHVGGTSPVSRTRFHDILNEMALYARQHFQAEEALLKKVAYSDLQAQEHEHQAYDEQIADWSFDATMGTLNMQDTHAFLSNWWKDHILVSDMKYRPLMERKG